MNKTKGGRDWLIIAIFVLICALTWVATNTYHDYINKKEIIARKDLLEPLEPEIDQTLFETLKSKTNLSEEELAKILSSSNSTLLSVSPTPIAIPEESSTPIVEQPQEETL